MALAALKSVTVYCGSADNLAPIYLETAWQMGVQLAERGIALVFGGGKTGMMGALADGVLANHGQVIGVINDSLNTSRLAHAGLTRMEVLPDIQVRKARMSALADAFIAMPGGFGTFDEVFETLTWAQLCMHHKGVGFLNIQHYFDPLLEMVDHAIAEGFIYPEHRQLLCSSADPAELLDLLAAYTPPKNLNLWTERE